jgi:hypothetical protein
MIARRPTLSPLTVKAFPVVMSETPTLIVAAAEVPAGVMQAVQGFVDGGGLLFIPIFGAFIVVGLVAGVILWSAQPAVRDEDD